MTDGAVLYEGFVLINIGPLLFGMTFETDGIARGIGAKLFWTE